MPGRMSLGTLVASFDLRLGFEPHSRHWNPFPLPSDLVVPPHTSQRGFM